MIEKKLNKMEAEYNLVKKYDNPEFSLATPQIDELKKQ